MNTYRVITKQGLTAIVKAEDREHAQELAIEHWEATGQVHDEIVVIERI